MQFYAQLKIILRSKSYYISSFYMFPTNGRHITSRIFIIIVESTGNYESTGNSRLQTTHSWQELDQHRIVLCSLMILCFQLLPQRFGHLGRGRSWQTEVDLHSIVDEPLQCRQCSDHNDPREQTFPQTLNTHKHKTDILARTFQTKFI